MKSQNKSESKTARIIKVGAALVFLAYVGTVAVRAYGLRRAKPLPSMTETQKAELENILDSAYPQRNAVISPLPYKTKKLDLNIGARSAILIEEKTGSILYEKNADEIIPPASLTKIFAMYVVLDEVRRGSIALNDIVPLPKECWACYMPPHSSLMFLGKNQRVTVQELLTGLAVCSGNDAAYALAFYVCGSVSGFVERMNAAARENGLTHTHFEEVSGYSEHNTTTAREMAAFSKIYLERFPESLSMFHSRLSFKYPEAHNLAPEDENKPRAQDWSKGLPEHITMGIYQENTNPLLGTLEGADGLKTGYIDESGYNLVLTVKRGNMRIISVTLGGQGSTLSAGQAGRVRDGNAAASFAYGAFSVYENPLLMRAYSIPAAFADTQRINLVPAFEQSALCAPKSLVSELGNGDADIKINLRLPKLLKGGMQAGAELGAIEYTMNGIVLQTVPLVCERTVKRANLWICAADLIAQKSIF